MNQQFEQEKLKQSEIIRLQQLCDNLTRRLDAQKSMNANKMQGKEVSMGVEETTHAELEEGSRRLRQLEADNSRLSNTITELKDKLTEVQSENSKLKTAQREQDAELQHQIQIANNERKEKESLKAIVEELQQRICNLETEVYQRVPPNEFPQCLSQEQTDPHHMEREVPEAASTPSGQPIRQDTNSTPDWTDDYSWMMEGSEKNDDFYYRRQPPPQVVEASHPWRKVKKEILAHSRNMLRPVGRHPTMGESPPQQVPDVSHLEISSP